MLKLNTRNEERDASLEGKFVVVVCVWFKRILANYITLYDVSCHMLFFCLPEYSSKRGKRLIMEKSFFKPFLKYGRVNDDTLLKKSIEGRQLS